MILGFSFVILCLFVCFLDSEITELEDKYKKLEKQIKKNKKDIKELGFCVSDIYNDLESNDRLYFHLDKDVTKLKKRLKKLEKEVKKND